MALNARTTVRERATGISKGMASRNAPEAGTRGPATCAWFARMKRPRPKALPREVASTHATVCSKFSLDSDESARNSSTPWKRIVSASSIALAMARSPNAAHVTSPVRPSPPMVAAKRSALREGEHSTRLPSERSSSKARTWHPNVPARWWFLPWTSLAIAPPIVTRRVPGVTGRNHPAGTMASRIRSTVAPASHRTMPFTRSKAMRRSSRVVSTRVPPSLRQLSP
jgi:hypothetical protein